MNRTSAIYVAGHRGLVGSALLRRLEARGYTSLITRSHRELDLEEARAVDAFFSAQRPEYVFLAAARVGGILANQDYPVDFLLRNLKIQNNVIESCWRHKAKGLLFLGSSCVYPRLAPQPLREEYLLTGPLEPTNEPYALGKIAGIELCSAFNRQYGTRFISVMPTNLYGPGDRYDLQNSHVLPALIRKFHLARLAAQGDWKGVQRDRDCHGPIPDRILGGLRAIAAASGHSPPDSIAVDGGSFAAPHGAHAAREGASAFRPAVVLWGTGKPRREFLYSEDAADACIFLMERVADLFQEANGGARAAGASGRAEGASLASRHLCNVGCGQDLTIRELAQRVAAVVGYDGPVEWDVTKPDGTPRKLLDVSVLKGLGWTPRVHLQEGIGRAYADYVARSR